MGALVEITVPSDQREGTESVIGRWLKAVGDMVKENEPLLEINTDKVTLEVASPATGVLREITKNPKEKVDLSETLGKIEVTSGAAIAAPKQELPNKPEAAQRKLNGNQAAVENLSPAVKKALKENNLELSKISGSGKDGRVTIEDVEKYLNKGSNKVRPAELSGAVRKVQHSPMRKSIAEHMVHSMAVAPHVTTVFQVDLSKVLADKDRQKATFESKGVKLTLTPYFIRAAVEALKEVPEVNSRWSDDALEIIPDLNIGVAAAVENSQGGSSGLVVPVILRAQSMDLFKVASELQQMTTKARAGKLSPQELKGGTFTISNHGVSGSLFASPIIINQPQSAILGIGKIEKRVIIEEVNGRDSISVIPAAYVTLTIDHRVLDGFLANRFLTKFVRVLEHW